MTRFGACLAVCLAFCCNVPGLYADMPWEIRARNGSSVWEGNDVPGGETRALHLGCDLEGKSKKVTAGNQLWTVDHLGPDTVRIKAAEGKLKGYYLTTGVLGGFYLSQTPEDFIVEQKGSGK